MGMISSDVLFHPQSKDVQITVRGGRTITKLESENLDFLFFKIKKSQTDEPFIKTADD